MHKSVAAHALRLGLAVLVALSLVAAPAAPRVAAAPAAPALVILQVDRTDDSPAATACQAFVVNDCSLRGAVTTANANSSAVIQLVTGATYTLTQVALGDLNVVANTTILPVGSCPSLFCFTTIKGGPGWADRLLSVEYSATVGITPTVVISGVTFTGGNANNGGALLNYGTLTLYDSFIYSNTVGGWGGGIYSSGGVLHVERTYIGYNRAQTLGGGLVNEGGTVTLYNSTVISNSTFGVTPGQGTGGGVVNLNSLNQLVTGVLVISNTAIITNTTPITNGYGGGVYNDGLTTIYSSTIRGNVAQYGGGLDSNNGVMTVTASLLLTNTAGGGGGGIRNDTPTLITNTQIMGNSSDGTGGGIVNSANLRVVNSLIQGNYGFQGGGVGTGAIAAHVWLTNTPVLSNTAIYGGGLGGYGMYTLAAGSHLKYNESYEGGAADIFSTGFLEIGPGIQVSYNSVGGGSPGGSRGGAINNAGVLLLTGVELRENSVPNGQGGALHNALGASARLTDTVILENSAPYGGGGIANAGALTMTHSVLASNAAMLAGGGITNTGSLSLTNSTLSGNLAGFGGGLWNGGTVRQSFVTIAANTATSGTGGLQNTGLFTTTASLLAENTGPSTDCTGAVSSLGYNLVEGTTGCTVTGGPNDQLNVTALLAVLIPAGGTWIHDLEPNSPALDNGPDACPADDQAHNARPRGFGCDIGAFESLNYTVFYLFLPLTLR